MLALFSSFTPTGPPLLSRTVNGQYIVNGVEESRPAACSHAHSDPRLPLGERAGRPMIHRGPQPSDQRGATLAPSSGTVYCISAINMRLYACTSSQVPNWSYCISELEYKEQRAGGRGDKPLCQTGSSYTCIVPYQVRYIDNIT